MPYVYDTELLDDYPPKKLLLKMSRKNQNKLILGDWNAICDVCRFKFKASDLRRRWDNLMVCEKDWEPRHPQDFIRAIPDMQALPWTRPETSDVSISGGSASSDLPSTFNTLAGEENPSATQVGPDRAPYYNTFAAYTAPVPTLSITPMLDSMTLSYSISCKPVNPTHVHICQFCCF